MHRTKFGTSGNDTTGENRSGHHHYKTCNGKPLNPRKPGIRDRIKHKTIPIPDPVLTEAKVPFFPRGAPPPRSPTPGTTTPGPGRTQTPRWASPPWRKTQCRSLFLRTKGLCALFLELPPRRLIPTCRKMGSAPYSAPPSPPGEAAHATPAGGKLRRSPGRATSLLLPPETATPAPRPAGRAAPPADETREEPRGREPSRRSGPAQPTHLPLPGPARSPGPPAPEPVGEGQAPGFHGAEKAAARRTRGGRGGRNPGALGRAAASLSSPPGRLGPSAACASSGWRFGWAGPGSPAPGRPNPAGAQAPSRGRQGAGCGAGRPAGGRAACCGCAGAEIAGDCAVGHSPQSGCATVGLRRGDCDRAGSSQPPATSGNGERCRLCRRRRRRGGGGEGGGTHATHGSASPPGDRHDGEAGAALATPGRGLSAVPSQPPAASSASRAAVQP